MKPPSAIRQQFVLWGLILGLWALLVVAFAGQLVFTSPSPLGWQQAMHLSLRDWLPWAVLAPAVGWLATRFPLERRKLALSIPIHVVACMGAIVFCQVLTQLDPPAQGPMRGQDPLRDQPPYGFRGGPRRDGPPPDGPPPFPPDRPEDLPPDGPLRQGRPAPFLNALVMQGKFNLPLYWVVVSIVHAFGYYRRSQERERTALELEARLAEARLQALRNQLHPHFLFNTLHAISTLVHKDPDAADEMISNLSELLRAALDTSDRQEVPLRQELDFLDRYLDIQQVRFGERLRIVKQIDAAALDTQVPTLILQPLVENALKHGIEPNPGPGLVTIEAQRQEQTLQLVVRDNGAGPKKSAGQQEGIGIANTRARLHELYGPRARLKLTSASAGGFEVEIILPVREASPHEHPRLNH
jgi:two-component system, LytTR family, sensor kinase